MIRVFLFLFSFSSLYASAQLPETVVYLIDMNRSVKGYSFSSPKIISKKIGYNNQPYFTPDEKYIYYVSSIDSANTEIYQYDLKNKKNKRLTKTREPEYSPRYSPDMNGISCVSVERDKTTQHLYIYNLKFIFFKEILNFKSS